jgi:hypothetical protein
MMKRVLVILVGLMGMISCSREDAQVVDVEFILPKSYLGAFKVIEDKKEGIEALPINNKLSLKVPVNGILRVKNLKPIREWHKPSARYSKGGLIPFGIADMDDKKDVCFFNLWTESNGATYYFIGEKKDFLIIQKGSPFEVEKYMPKN